MIAAQFRGYIEDNTFQHLFQFDCLKYFIRLITSNDRQTLRPT